MRVKICGITNLADAQGAAAAGADFVGLVLAPSIRQVSLTVAREIVVQLPPTTPAVLVFRNAPLDEVLRATDETEARWVQLHGHESPAYLHDLLAQRPNLHIIKACEVGACAGSAETLAQWCSAGPAGLAKPATSPARQRAPTPSLANPPAPAEPPDVLLLDAPKDEPHPGFDAFHEFARQLGAAGAVLPLWCAGGLTPDNVAAVVAAGLYDGVDVARGVEAQPGVKDPAALRRFITAARASGSAT